MEKNNIKKISKKIFLGLIVVLLLFALVEFAAAGKYKATVKISQEENYLGLNPASGKFDFGDLSRGVGGSRYLSLENNGSIPVYVKIFKFGNISDLIKISNDNFILSPGSKTEIDFHLTVLPSVNQEEYSGWVLVFRIPKIL